MVVKLVFDPNSSNVPTYERLIECDTLHVTRGKEMELSFYESGKHIENTIFRDECVAVFVMENGKTVDTFSFEPRLD